MIIRLIRHPVLLALVLAVLPGYGAAAGDLPAGGLPAVRDGSDGFNTAQLVATSFKGMLDSSCGGYCIVGICVHTYWRLSLTKKPEFRTIVSPKLRHSVPELLVESYNHPGTEPYLEWRQTVGTVFAAAADALGMAGGRPDPKRLDQHQSVSFKELDIIGHPFAVIPQALDNNGDLNLDGNAFNIGFWGGGNATTLSDPFAQPAPFKAPRGGQRKIISFDGGKVGIDANAMLAQAKNGVVAQGMGFISNQYAAALNALKAVDITKDIQQLAKYFKNVSMLVNTASQAAEIAARSSGWANLVNPSFRAPRLICPNSVKPLQPYYLSFADAFWWRSGYPVTDGPFSGTDHSGQVLNPFSGDTLPVTANPMNPLSEVWGNKYPREGMLNQNHDAKTASVIAWRGMDVLMKSVPAPRIGIKVPTTDQGSGGSVGQARWQMIYPEVKSCQATPYYPSGGIMTDFMEPNFYGSYAWNYYRTYTCCSNSKGSYSGRLSFNFPKPLCVKL